MSDSHSPSGSTPEPFETYRESLLKAEVEAKEARNVAETLDTLEEVIPQWWRMSDLIEWDVPYEPIQKWQKEAQELLESAQGDLTSGNMPRLREGFKKVTYSKSKIDEVKKEMQSEIKSEKNKTESKLGRKSKIEDKISDIEEEAYKSKKRPIFSGAKYAIFSLPVGYMLAGIVLGFPEDGNNVPVVITAVFALAFLIGYNMVEVEIPSSEIDELKNISDSIESSREDLERLKRYKKVIENSGTQWT